MCINIILLLFILSVKNVRMDFPVTRNMYNTISNLMGEEEYPEDQWQDRIECFDQLSPQMNGIMEKAWEGVIEFWESRGQEGDTWKSCDHDKWFESNCTYQPGLGLAIWEPCNYASNLAYDRLAVEICKQHSWTLPEETITKIAQGFAINTVASAFFHGSQTRLGASQDGMSNDLFAYILHQSALVTVPYDPVLHDLSYTPRGLSGEEVIDLLLEMYKTKPVQDWYDESHSFRVAPSVQNSFAGIFGFVLRLLFDLETTTSVGGTFMDALGVLPEDKTFFVENYLPRLYNATADVSISSIEKAELLENTSGTALKLLYAFVWQEDTFDLGEILYTPEENAFGAALLPHINSYANNLTTWDLYVPDVQSGTGYPGSGWCNDLIPHAKWHVQTSASLSDAARLVDEVLRLVQGS